MAGAGEEPDEFTELFGFLSDPRVDVRKMAAEGVLAQTETQDFVEYAQQNARKVARPLLRLAERAEADFIGSTASAAGASGNTEQRERAIRAAKLEASESLEAGSAALQSLVNCSGIPQVRDQLIEMSAIRRCCESLRGGWLEGRSEFSHWHAMLLANLSTVEAGQKALCADEGLFRFLVAAYVTKPRPPPRDGRDDTLFCLGKVACNVCALPEGRAFLTAGDDAAGTLTALTVELGDRERRPDVLAIFRNLCVDKDCHEVLVQLDLTWAMARFLYPWEKAAEEKRQTLPEELRKSLEAEGATMTADSDVRAAAANCIVGLCRTEMGRTHLRASGCYEVMRAWHLEETDEEVKQAIETAVPAVHLSEEQLEADKLEADKMGSSAKSVRHMLMFQLKDPADSMRIKVALEEMAAKIPLITAYTFGADAGLTDPAGPAGPNRSVVWTANFASKEDYLAYSTHPDHMAVIPFLLEAMIPETVAVIQHELEAPLSAPSVGSGKWL